MRMTPTGELQTLNGHPILDAGNAPILLDPNAGPPRIGRDGTITQNNRAGRRHRPVQHRRKAKLTRFRELRRHARPPATPVVEFTKTGMRQGFVERANVNPVLEMSRLIMISRAFEVVTASLASGDLPAKPLGRSEPPGEQPAGAVVDGGP